MIPSACGGSVGTTGEALLQSIDTASPNDSSRPLRSCTSRLSKGEKEGGRGQVSDVLLFHFADFTGQYCIDRFIGMLAPSVSQSD